MTQECSLERSCSMQIRHQCAPESRSEKFVSYTLVNDCDINNIRFLRRNQSRGIRHRKPRRAE